MIFRHPITQGASARAVGRRKGGRGKEARKYPHNLSLCVQWSQARRRTRFPIISKRKYTCGVEGKLDIITVLSNLAWGKGSTQTPNATLLATSILSNMLVGLDNFDSLELI